MTVKELVSPGMICTFDSYRAGFFYYNVYNMNETPKGSTYQFIIPADDIGNATLSKIEKPITLMRWIRKSIEDNTLIDISKQQFHGL